MVAYSFNKRFLQPIVDGTKRQTIRKSRKRDARPGEELQLYVGMRTRYCELIGRATCSSVDAIELDFRDGREGVILGGEIILDDLDTFARRDGFEDWRDLRQFWRHAHPGVLYFNGIIVQWGKIRYDDRA